MAHGAALMRICRCVFVRVALRSGRLWFPRAEIWNTRQVEGWDANVFVHGWRDPSARTKENGASKAQIQEKIAFVAGRLRPISVLARCVCRCGELKFNQGLGNACRYL